MKGDEFNQLIDMLRHEQKHDEVLGKGIIKANIRLFSYDQLVYIRVIVVSRDYELWQKLVRECKKRPEWAIKM